MGAMANDDHLRRVLREDKEPRALASPRSASDDQLRAFMRRDRLVYLGHPDDRGDFPSCVSILDGAETVGSGVRITPRWVLTAAHNFTIHSEDNQRWWIRQSWQRVQVGTTDKNLPMQAAIESVIVHRKYDPTPGELLAGARPKNDIALVRLAHDLPGQTAPIAGLFPQREMRVTIVGYGGNGLTNDIGRGTRRSAEVVLQPDDLEAPSSIRAALGYHPPEEFVLGYRPDVDREAQPDSRRGDSGGPVFANRTVIGITCRAARNDKNGQERNFGIYTSIPKFLSWIQDECDPESPEVI